MKPNVLLYTVVVAFAMSGCNNVGTSPASSTTSAASEPSLFATSTCLTGQVKFSGTGWWVNGTIDITNTCSSDIKLPGQTLTFTSQTTNGSYVNLGTLTNWWVNGAKYTLSLSNGGNNKAVGTFDADNEGLIHANQTIQFSGGADIHTGTFDTDSANNTLSINGAAPSPVPSPTPSPSPSPIPSPSPNPSVKPSPSPSPTPVVSPTPAAKAGSAILKVGNYVTNFTDNLKIEILNAKESNAVVATYYIPQGGSATTTKLPISDTTHAYKVRVAGIADPLAGLFYVESGLPTLAIKNNQITTLDIPFKASTTTLRSVTLKISGLQANDSARVSFQDAAGKYNYVKYSNQLNASTVYKIENNTNLGYIVTAGANGYSVNPLSATQLINKNLTLTAAFATTPLPSPSPSPTVNPSPSPVPTVSPVPQPTIAPLPTTQGLPQHINFNPQSIASGKIYYHLNLPYGSGNVETLTLSNNYTDLIISNYVAGALLGRMIHEKAPTIKINHDYIYGSLLAQLLQENINTAGYTRTSNFINSGDGERAMLLAGGQGGPYQINDYAKRLETSAGIGLVNFVALQKGLGYSVELQDNGTQTGSKGPDSLDDKFFGPMAAAYFHLNDMNRLAMNNADTWGPQYAYYSKCMANLAQSQSADYAHNIYDMILNAAYNAGTYSTIIKDYFRICAGMYTTAPEMTQVLSMGDYSLSDSVYRSTIGTNEAIGSTFIIYPRQVRIYLDQVYNQKSYNSAAISGTNVVNFSLQDVEFVFQNAMGTLAYINGSSQYVFIAPADSKAAFETALASNGLSISGFLALSDTTSRAKFFKLLDDAINNLATNLNINFAAVTQTTIGSSSGGGGGSSGTTCQSAPQVYPAGRGSYTSNSIVKASDGNLYKCNIAGWCNSTAEWAYAPASGAYWADAWVLYSCQ